MSVDSAQSSRSVERYLSDGCALVAFLLPLKLSFTYIALIPLILAWLLTKGSLLPRILSSSAAAPITAPLGFFMLVATLSAPSGLSLSHSIPSLISLVFFALTIPVFAESAQPMRVAAALIAGQTVAAIHSFFDATFPNSLPRTFLGKVTESGQLAITVLVALGMLIAWRRALTKQPDTSPLVSRYACVPFGIATALASALIALGFRTEAALPWTTTLTLSLLVVICLWLVASSVRRSARPASLAILLSTAQLPLLLCALIVNLKRGPWLGVLVGGSLFFLIYARKFVLIALLGACSLFVALPPVQQRLLDSYEHFTISGGRSTMWRIGVELASEYPLGVGYHNSGILRQFAPEIPHELKHFHNNLINIAAETGWLGVAVFAWLLISAVRICFKDRSAPLYVAIGCAIISWQVAGLVEYNFGDSEITLIVWALLGLVLQRELREPHSAEQSEALAGSEHDRAPA
jgi:O-antigen ligase